MVRGTNKPLSDRQQLRSLQEEVASLRRIVDSIVRAKPRTIPTGVTLAQTIDDGSYPGGAAQRFPAVFVDATWDSLDSEVDKTPRSESRQFFALCVEPTSLAIGTYIFVRPTRNGEWLIVDASEGLGIGETQTGGIGEGSYGTVTAKVLNSDGTLSTALDDASDPIEETVYSPFGTIAEDRIIAYGRDKRSGRLFAITEKCPS